MTVNNLRKASSNDEVVALSKTLIKNWKKLLSNGMELICINFIELSHPLEYSRNLKNGIDYSNLISHQSKKQRLGSFFSLGFLN